MDPSVNRTSGLTSIERASCLRAVCTIFTMASTTASSFVTSSNVSFEIPPSAVTEIRATVSALSSIPLPPSQSSKSKGACFASSIVSETKPLSLEIIPREPIIEPSNNSIIPKEVQVGGDENNSIKNNSIKNNSIENNSVENKILDIINEKSLNLTNQTNISDFENKSNETFLVKNATEQSINNNIESKYPIDYSSKKASKTQSELDSKLEKILKNDLGDSDTESTMIDNNQSNYQEVFSNSNTSHDSSLNSQQKNDELNKNKFFANYLNI